MREERNEGREKGRRIEVMEEVGREGRGQIIQCGKNSVSALN